MAKIKTAKARIERRHEQWLEKEKNRTGESESEIIRVLIDREISKCNAQELKWCPICGKHSDHTSGQCPEFLAIRERIKNEKQGS